jgi:D-glycero-D-manno-heptose 1,7-bisphosphate phosphatase
MKSSSQPVESFHGVCAVFLDRDGVINRKLVEGRYIRNWSEFEILPGVEEAIASLNRRQCRVFVTTNQRGIALGLCTAEEVEELHRKMQQHLAMYGAHVDGFYYCPHDEDQCDCRKPGTGLLERAVREFPDITPETSVMIGDSLSDIRAAQKFGCRSIFIEGDPQTRKAGAETAERLADATAASLTEAVVSLLQV